MIAKKIFYCWFGKGEKSELNKRCIASWEKQCPDYEIIEINEENFDYNAFEYSRISYEHKNWSYVTDVARMEVLQKESGFYLDTDVELLKSLDSLRDNNAIVHQTGYGCYACGVLGCEKFPKIYTEAYKRLAFDTSLYIEINKYAYNHYNLLGESIKREDDVTFLGIEYFGNPRSTVTEKTIGIHWDENSWYDSWTGDFTPMQDFIPFAIYNPAYDEAKTKLWFGNSDTEDRVLYVDGEVNLDIIELGNYFMNPRVTKVMNERCKFLRLGATGQTKTKRLENGCYLTYTINQS